MAGAVPLTANKPFMIDPTVPRPSARFPVLPTPFNYEKPSAQVPDVSLIFDSSSLSNQTVSPILRRPQNSAKQSRAVRPPTPPPGTQGLGTQALHSLGSLEVQMMYDLMKKQEEAIVRLEMQLKSVIQSQDTQSKDIKTILNSINERLQVVCAPPVKTCDQSVQTTINEEVGTKKVIETCTTAVHIQTSTSISEMCIASQNNCSSAIEKNRSSSSAHSSLSSISPPNVPQNKPRVENSNVICAKNVRKPKQQLPAQQQQEQLYQRPVNRFENVRDTNASIPLTAFSGDDNKEDLSTILRDLQLPTIEENSLFSEVSIPPIDMQDFNDSNNDSDCGSPRIGPSASACGNSSSDEEDFAEAVQPTVTFYRNVIGNVNKMLENTQDSAMFGSNDTTTIYGMSSNNLSFATKQYLQKYGLVEKSSKAKQNKNFNPEVAPVPRILPADQTANMTRDRNHRILNLNALKNQPKFI